MDHIIYRDYITNRRSLTYCSRVTGSVGSAVRAVLRRKQERKDRRVQKLCGQGPVKLSCKLCPQQCPRGQWYRLKAKSIRRGKILSLVSFSSPKSRRPQNWRVSVGHIYDFEYWVTGETKSSACGWETPRAVWRCLSTSQRGIFLTPEWMGKCWEILIKTKAKRSMK